jgi:catalase
MSRRSRSSTTPERLGGPTGDRRVREQPLRLEGLAGSYDHRHGNDHYQQAGDVYRSTEETARARLVGNIAASLGAAPVPIQLRQIAHFWPADKESGDRVAQTLGRAQLTVAPATA